MSVVDINSHPAYQDRLALSQSDLSDKEIYCFTSGW